MCDSQYYTDSGGEKRAIPAKRKKNNTHYTPPRRNSETPADGQFEPPDTAEQVEERSPNVSITPEMLLAELPKEHQQWVSISEGMASEFSHNPEIVTTIPALKQGIRTTGTGSSSWKLLVQHCANLLSVALDLKPHQTPSSNNNMEMVNLLTTISSLEIGCLLESARTTTVELSEATAATDSTPTKSPAPTEPQKRVYTTEELSDKVDKLSATIDTLTTGHGTAEGNKENQKRSYASVPALPRKQSSAKDGAFQPVTSVNTQVKKNAPSSKETTPVTDRRFLLQMETPLDADAFRFSDYERPN